MSAIALLLLTGAAAGQCALNPTSPSVTICSPANGQTVSSPVSVVAGTTDNAHPVVAMKVYLDNVQVYAINASQLSTSLSMPGGQHNITVNAWDSSGAVFKATAIISVIASGTAPVSVAISPNSATLAPGQTQQFSATVLNTTNSAVTWSVDGFYNGNTTVGTVSNAGLYTAGTALGQHNVVATSVADPTRSDTAVVTVTSTASGGGGTCTPTSGAPSLTICSPLSGASVTSPVHVQAVAVSNTAVVKFLVYVDSVLAYQALNTSSIDTSLSMATGSHSLTVQFYNGAWVKQTESIVVTTSTPAVTVSISPTSANLAPNGTQQFTATVQNTSNTAVSWTVDGTPNGNSTVGTITGTGNTITYTAPANAGSHTVTATSVADASKNASATVTVTIASGTCTSTAPAPSLTICSPAANANVTSPVHIQAAAASSTAVTKFLVYVDYNLAYQALNASTIDTSLAMTTGTHNLAIQFYNGAWVKQTENITVTSSAPVVAVSISPTSASLAPNGTQQFTATVQNTSNTAVNWTVDGTPNGNTTVGTITGTGNTVTYTAPANAGFHTVTATSVADTTKSASATVTVNTTAQGFPHSSHVFVVMEENQDFSQVFPAGSATNCASSGMPYLCGLAAANGLALDFYANVHGSLLDYLYVTSGADWTGSPYHCTGSNCASQGVITGDNIVRALLGAGLTWRGYFEGMPSPGYTGGDTGYYVAHHNPFLWYSDVATSGETLNMYPFTQFAADLQSGTFANFNFIVPNILDDADGTGSQSSATLLSSADIWLRNNIGPLLSTAPFKPGGDGILMIVFDEASVAGKSGDTQSDNSCSATQTSGCGGHIAFVMVGPNVTPASTTSVTYHFQDMLHTILHLLGVSDYMNAASGAKDISLLPGTGQ